MIPSPVKKTHTQAPPCVPASQTYPIMTASMNPPNWPTIISVPVTTVASMGNVSSDEKFMLIGIIGTMKQPSVIILTEMNILSVEMKNVTIAIMNIVKQPKQQTRIICLKFFLFYMMPP